LTELSPFFLFAFPARRESPSSARATEISRATPFRGASETRRIFKGGRERTVGLAPGLRSPQQGLIYLATELAAPINLRLLLLSFKSAGFHGITDLQVQVASVRHIHSFYVFIRLIIMKLTMSIRVNLGSQMHARRKCTLSNRVN
jgi:hypothetical protein